MLIGIIVSLLSGGSIVIARTVNARLAIKTSVLQSTFYNYVVGFFVSLLVLLSVFQIERGQLQIIPPELWIYSGGIISVFVVLISNATVAKISSFYMTLLLFIGQVFTGVFLDMMISHTFSIKYIIGGIFVALGLSINVFFDQKKA